VSVVESVVGAEETPVAVSVLEAVPVSVLEAEAAPVSVLVSVLEAALLEGTLVSVDEVPGSVLPVDDALVSVLLGVANGSLGGPSNCRATSPR
jgi:hypothetical protein